VEGMEGDRQIVESQIRPVFIAIVSISLLHSVSMNSGEESRRRRVSSTSPTRSQRWVDDSDGKVSCTVEPYNVHLV
jgi:hypothetical protein